MNCPQCNIYLPDLRKFCVVCGCALPQIKLPVNQSPAKSAASPRGHASLSPRAWQNNPTSLTSQSMSDSLPTSPKSYSTTKLGQPGTPNQSGHFSPKINMLPTVTNLSADIEAKTALKFDPYLEDILWTWMEELIGEQIGEKPGRLSNYLKSGVALCKVANAIKPGIIPKINNRPLAFFYLENIGYFLNSLSEFGIPRNDMFLATDVVEDKNNSTVIGALVLFAKTTTKLPGYAGPPFSEDKNKASSIYGVPTAGPVENSQNNTSIPAEYQEQLDWINTTFPSRKVTSIAQFRDGIVLRNLVEHYTGKKINMFNEAPRDLLECNLNLTKIYNALFSCTLSPVPYSPAEIASNSAEAIFGFIEHVRATFDLQYMYQQLGGRAEDYEEEYAEGEMGHEAASDECTYSSRDADSDDTDYNDSYNSSASGEESSGRVRKYSGSSSSTQQSCSSGASYLSPRHIKSPRGSATKPQGHQALRSPRSPRLPGMHDHSPRNQPTIMTGSGRRLHQTDDATTASSSTDRPLALSSQAQASSSAAVSPTQSQSLTRSSSSTRKIGLSRIATEHGANDVPTGPLTPVVLHAPSNDHLVRTNSNSRDESPQIFNHPSKFTSRQTRTPTIETVELHVLPEDTELVVRITESTRTMKEIISPVKDESANGSAQSLSSTGSAVEKSSSKLLPPLASHSDGESSAPSPKRSPRSPSRSPSKTPSKRSDSKSVANMASSDANEASASITGTFISTSSSPKRERSKPALALTSSNPGVPLKSPQLPTLPQPNIPKSPTFEPGASTSSQSATNTPTTSQPGSLHSSTAALSRSMKALPTLPHRPFSMNKSDHQLILNNTNNTNAEKVANEQALPADGKPLPLPRSSSLQDHRIPKSLQNTLPQIPLATLGTDQPSPTEAGREAISEASSASMAGSTGDQLASPSSRVQSKRSRAARRLSKSDASPSTHHTHSPEPLHAHRPHRFSSSKDKASKDKSGGESSSTTSAGDSKSGATPSAVTHSAPVSARSNSKVMRRKSGPDVKDRTPRRSSAPRDHTLQSSEETSDHHHELSESRDKHKPGQFKRGEAPNKTLSSTQPHNSAHRRQPSGDDEPASGADQPSMLASMTSSGENVPVHGVSSRSPRHSKSRKSRERPGPVSRKLDFDRDVKFDGDDQPSARADHDGIALGRTISMELGGGVTITERQFDDDEEYNPLKKLQLSSTERKGMSGLLQKDPSLGGSTSEYSNWHNDDEKEKGKQKVMVDFSSLKSSRAKEEKSPVNEFSFLEDTTGTELLKQKLNEKREEKLLGDSRHVPLSHRDFADSQGKKTDTKLKKLKPGAITEPPPLSKSQLAQIAMRKHIFNNFTSSETTFISSLGSFQSKLGASIQNTDPRSPLNILFIGIGAILEVAKRNNKKLKETKMKLQSDHTTLLGACFLPIVHLIPFVNYFDQYSRIAALDRFLSKPECARVKQCVDSYEQEGTGLSVEALFAMPVDRMMRYLGFFQDLLRFTSKQSADYKVIKSVVTDIIKMMLTCDPESLQSTKPALVDYWRQFQNNPIAKSRTLDISEFTLPLVMIDPLEHGLYHTDKELVGNYDQLKIKKQLEVNVFHLKKTGLTFHEIPDYYTNNFLRTPHLNLFCKNVNGDEPMKYTELFSIFSISEKEVEGQYAGLINSCKGFELFSIPKETFPKSGIKKELLLKYLHQHYPKHSFCLLKETEELLRDIASIEVNLRQEVVRFRVGLIYSNGKEADPLEMMHTLPVSESFQYFCHNVMGAASVFNPHRYLDPGFTYTWKNKQIVYFPAHVLNVEQRRQHLGNTNVLVFYHDSTEPFDGSQLDSLGAMSQCFIIVQPQPLSKFRVSILCRSSLETTFSPELPRNYLFDLSNIKDFILLKAYNASMSVIISPPTCVMFQVPRGTALNEVVERHANGWSVKASLKTSRDDSGKRRLRDTLG